MSMSVLKKAKYKSSVYSIGELASEFFDEGILVFFGRNAPEELHEYSILHTATTKLRNDIAPGDVLVIDNQEFPILAVGPLASTNIRYLNHLVIKFNGSTVAELDGDITLPQAKIPVIKKGSILEIKNGAV